MSGANEQIALCSVPGDTSMYSDNADSGGPRTCLQDCAITNTLRLKLKKKHFVHKQNKLLYVLLAAYSEFKEKTTISQQHIS